ncbi:hypothetical protein ACFL5V_05585 [Fibrobacterota bacterium]
MIAGRKILVLLISVTALYSGPADQSNLAVAVKYIGLTCHPFGVQGFDFALAVDEGGFFVLQVGLETDVDYYLYECLILRASGSLYKDCANVWAGYYHLAPRLSLPITPELIFRIGIGPTIIWRENWAGEFDRYGGNIFYGDRKEGGTFETAFLWYGGNLDLDWKVNEDYSILYSVIPGLPSAISNSIGVRRRF